jgi:NADPH:quinone reductase-like Zn-dependent oxidoreductase
MPEIIPDIPATAKAGVVHHFGPPSVIEVEDIPVARPAPNEVLIRVRAAGVGPWDSWIRAGKSALPQPLPLILGSDLAGMVVAAGGDVTGLAPGDEVFGVTNPGFTGAYAEYAIADAGMMAHKPASLSFVEAASVPVVAVTAWQALFEEAGFKEAGLTQGATVLIHGAAGNVGAYAVQLARMAGLHVIATARSRDVERVRTLGADIVIDAEREHFEDKVGGLDAVIDLVGGDVQKRSFAVLKRGGKLVSAVSAPDEREAAAHGVSAHFFLVKVTRDRLEQIAASIDRGALRSNIGKVLPLSAAREAHEMLDGLCPKPAGKIVLIVE